MIYVWLDDIRPPPKGWVWVQHLGTLKELLALGDVRRLSLDHDLGACANCMGGLSVEEYMEKTNYLAMPHCSHVGTGYDLVCWMEETGNWPKEKPTVHSANPVGRAKMLQVIEKEWARRVV